MIMLTFYYSITKYNGNAARSALTCDNDWSQNEFLCLRLLFSSWIIELFTILSIEQNVNNSIMYILTLYNLSIISLITIKILPYYYFEY